MAVKQEHRRRRAERRRRQQVIWYVLGAAIGLVVIVLAVSALVAANNSGTAADGDFQTTASGLQYRIIEEGTGPTAQPGDNVSVLYTGKFEDGTVFDSSELHGGQPYEFMLGTGSVIPGWDEGIALLNEGAKAELIIPPDLGYGPQGSGSIPPDTTLTFEVELVAINP